LVLQIPKKDFKLDQQVLLNSRLKLFSRKLRSKWLGPFIVKDVKSYGAIHIEGLANKRSWMVNGQSWRTTCDCLLPFSFNECVKKMISMEEIGCGSNENM